jgi:hypothetical protein
MIESWSIPFLDKFGGAVANIQIYEVFTTITLFQNRSNLMALVFCFLYSHNIKPNISNTCVLAQVSFVDSWLLSLSPIKRSFIKSMKKSKYTTMTNYVCIWRPLLFQEATPDIKPSYGGNKCISKKLFLYYAL